MPGEWRLDVRNVEVRQLKSRDTGFSAAMLRTTYASAPML